MATMHKTLPSRSPSHFESLSRLPEVKRRTGLPRASIYRLMAQKKFPAQVVLGGRSVAWVDSEIDLWISERIAARDK